MYIHISQKLAISKYVVSFLAREHYSPHLSKHQDVKRLTAGDQEEDHSPCQLQKSQKL